MKFWLLSKNQFYWTLTTRYLYNYQQYETLFDFYMAKYPFIIDFVCQYLKVKLPLVHFP